MASKRNILEIEKAVCSYYKIEPQQLYGTNNKYPANGARSVFMYMLYNNRIMTSYEIMGLFNYKSSRSVEVRVAEVQVAVKEKRTKYSEDVNKINEIIKANKLWQKETTLAW